jgi:transcriptional regulator with GAF, ATPase, and Fis domain
LIAAERVTVVHRRREALLRQARRFAAETDPSRLLDNLLNDAIELVDGSAGIVSHWDDEAQALVVVGAHDSRLWGRHVQIGHGASGQAAQRREAVLFRRGDAKSSDLESELESVIAVPLLHEAKVVGTLAVGTDRPDKLFSQADSEFLEMLASTASAALGALEHARLEGVLLAARTAQHELNNQLAVARGYAEMLLGSPDLPLHLHEAAEEVMNAADDAANIVRQMRSISHIHEHHWSAPGDTTINLDRSQTQRSA